MKKLALLLVSLSLPALAADPGASGLAPPNASMGIVECGKPVVLWVVMADGRVIRFDKDHRPKTEEGTREFLAWVSTGPTDLVTLPCEIST